LDFHSDILCCVPWADFICYYTEYMVKLINLVILLFSVILHEIAHGYVAYLYGDNTAKIRGRLTLDPRKHIDPIGTVLIPLMLYVGGSPVLFGWAKPVPIATYNLRDPRKDTVRVSLAGPLTNYSIAFIAVLLLKVAGQALLLKYILISTIFINIILGTFNLIPVPPLDGSRFVAYFLKGKAAYYYQSLEKYGFLIIFLALYLGLFDIILSSVMPLMEMLIK